MKDGFGYPPSVPLRIYQPFTLTVRCVLWAVWVVVALGVITVGSRSPLPNHPVGLLLLGLALAGSGLLALLTLFSPAVWQRLVDPEVDVRQARHHFYGLLGLGLAGAVMVCIALGRLL